jgi:hypothetical protein
MKYNISALYIPPISDYCNIVVYKARSIQRSSVQIGTNQNHVSLAKSQVISETYCGDNVLNWFNLSIN